MKTSPRLFVSLLALILWAAPTGSRGQTTSTLTNLHNFSVLNSYFHNADGARPLAAVVEGNDGNFYGAAFEGGSSGNGTIFKVTPAGVFTVLHEFNGADGEGPNALVLGRDGIFYGTASGGGDNVSGAGVVFTMTAAGEFKVLHNFTDEGTEGEFPAAGLVEGSDGNFYGTTYYGGGNGNPGTVFRITPSGAFATLHDFTGVGTDGLQPEGTLVEDGDGNFYGTTLGGGGDTQNGTVFKITRAGGFSTLHSFTGSGTDGAQPEAGLVEGSDGNFYGTTDEGGSGGQGTVFKITPSGVLTTLYNFVTTDAHGAGPEGALVKASDGGFYGTTAYGGGGDSVGTVFRITSAGVLTTVHSFAASGQEGGYPAAGLVQGRDGNFYGTTNDDGSGDDGTVFKLAVGPTITSSASAVAAVGKSFSYQIVATFKPTGYGVHGLPTGLSLNAKTGLITGTPTTPAKRSVTLIATNAFGIGTGTLTLTVYTTPIITSATTATATVGKAFSYQITARNNPTSFDATGLPSGLSVNKTTAVISGTPASTAAGTKPLHLSATNPAGTGTATLTLTIKVD